VTKQLQIHHVLLAGKFETKFDRVHLDRGLKLGHGGFRLRDAIYLGNDAR